MLIVNEATPSAPLWLLTDADLARWLAEQSAELSQWVRANGFQAEKQRVLALPGRGGAIGGAVVGLGPLGSLADLKLWHAAGLAERLPAQTYHVANELTPAAATQFALGWLIGAYRFTR